MAIRGGDTARSVPSGGKYQMTVDEFKNWLMKFDVDKDGRISRKELRRAVRSSGGLFSGWKSGRGMVEADADGSGFIDEQEIDCLLDFAETSMGFKLYY
ncbi:hypothetical protein ABFS82_08G049000 [Erythranthe guttata]|uniref:EF-hand domain-containing protein n=1 Tax=Erythranthe guttata TaxID=4155 RepID=A0A022RZH8_ERYGU|nr:hypothetical protein MIMGU_mgv1a016982mg [Erythranthe guttata]